jgi:hypothetical protein
MPIFGGIEEGRAENCNQSRVLADIGVQQSSNIDFPSV